MQRPMKRLSRNRIDQADPEVRVNRSRSPNLRKEPDLAGKKRPKSLADTEKKAPAKPKRSKKTSRGK
jgi:hypothetical protein